MIILPKSQFLWVNLEGASVSPCTFTISYLVGDIYNANDGSTSGATLVAMNKGGGIVHVFNFSIRNPNVANHTVTISKGQEGQSIIQFSCVLQEGDIMNYEDGSGLSVTDSNGNLKTTTSSISLPLSPTDISLANTHIIVGNASNVGADVAMSGDATIANTGAVTLANTAVTPASYTLANITVDSKGRVTAAANGTALVNPMTTLGDIIYESATPSPTRLAGNITTTRKFLRQTGTGAISAAPEWDTLLAADIPLTDTNLLVGNASNVAVSVALSGDATLANTGALTIANNAVTTAKINTNAVTYAKLQQGAAQTILVNNTNATANFAETPFYDVPLATYSGTITWNGTAPTTIISQQYAWSRIGGWTSLTLAVVYTNAGVTNTTVTFTLPPDCPTPATIAGLGANANEVMYMGTGKIEATITTAPGNNRSYIRKNAANNGYEVVVISASASAKVAGFTIQYRNS